MPRHITVTDIGKFNIINSKDQLPQAVNGIITLSASESYIFAGDVDLTGDRIVCGGNVTIRGTSSETSFLKSTGLVGNPLISTTFSLSMKDITIVDAETGVIVDGTLNSDLACDWTAVNFINCTTSVNITSSSNFLNFQCAYLNSGPAIFDGTIGTVAFDSCLFSAHNNQNAIVASDTLTITRRIRFVFCAFIINNNSVGILYENGVTIPNDQAIIESCNFAGDSTTYVSGITETDNRADWRDNKGIQNTATAGGYYVNDSVTATTIVQSVYSKIAGVTTAMAYLRRFTHTDNRLTYAGSLDIVVKLTVTLSANSGNNQVLGFKIYKNEVEILGTLQKVTTSGNGRSENVKLQTVVECSPTDYFEVWCTNQTSSTDITVTDINTIIERLD